MAAHVAGASQAVAARTAAGARPAPGLDQLVFYLPNAAAREHPPPGRSSRPHHRALDVNRPALPSVV